MEAVQTGTDGDTGNWVSRINLKHTLEEVLVDLLSVVLWHQHIGVEYLRLLKVVESRNTNFSFFFSTFPTLESVALVGGQ